MAEAAQESSKLNIFIFYSRDDLDFADQLEASLRLGNFETSIDRRGISGGEDWKTRLAALIRDSNTRPGCATPPASPGRALPSSRVSKRGSILEASPFVAGRMAGSEDKKHGPETP
jgi:hypothetical protein